eukprot:TRINITY_DN117_c0_g1_i1.p1 TRINITY_DN117_c0_g1~~TRINITY_DN117_c0_g1_i1.p1  ORF type:complete len:331 (-),score=41.36 TRINITY_DN117_c0_g1_i1:1070-2062(-)
MASLIAPPSNCQQGLCCWAREGEGGLACLENGGGGSRQVRLGRKSFQELANWSSSFSGSRSAEKLKEGLSVSRSGGGGKYGGRVPMVEARLFGPALFEASKLRVLFLGQGQEEAEAGFGAMHMLPRIYTLTHSDVTAKLTLAIAQEINKAQLKGWYSTFQRDEVVAEWKKVKGHMALHVHCHISGGNLYHNLIASFRSYIFRKELPVVLEAFVHGDKDLFRKQPELAAALVWVYFHSNVKAYNKLECWGPLAEAAEPVGGWASEAFHRAMTEGANLMGSGGRSWPMQLRPRSVCPYPCECCSRDGNLIPLPDSFAMLRQEQQHLQQQQQQ